MNRLVFPLGNSLRDKGPLGANVRKSHPLIERIVRIAYPPLLYIASEIIVYLSNITASFLLV